VTSRRSTREGFALLAVLWMLGGGALLGMLLVLSARDARGVATNRVALARARWIAEGCLERARAAVDDEASGDVIDDSLWTHLDRVIARSPVTRGCRLTIVPAGTTLDVNSASESRLRALFAELGASPAAADSLTTAILDWRDPDDDRRFAGAERLWYERAGRAPPRNANVASLEELASVRGMERYAHLDSVLGVEPDRVVLSRAPRAVLATLPGMTLPALAEIDRRRAAGDSAITLERLAALVDSVTREILFANVASLRELTTTIPDAWLLRAEASEGVPRVTARLELRVVRSGRRMAILRRRSDT
jgi:general secretion pathway protein K